jgi:hypothetical protein
MHHARILLAADGWSAAEVCAEGDLHILSCDNVANLGSAAGRSAAVEAGDPRSPRS